MKLSHIQDIPEGKILFNLESFNIGHFLTIILIKTKFYITLNKEQKVAIEREHGNFQTDQRVFKDFCFANNVNRW